jgi:hypothetical protein
MENSLKQVKNTALYGAVCMPIRLIRKNIHQKPQFIPIFSVLVTTQACHCEAAWQKRVPRNAIIEAAE